MLNTGDRIRIISSSKNRGITTGKIGYIVRALFQPTMRCLLIEAVFVASKPEHKFVVVDIDLTKQIRHKLINGDNIFQVAKINTIDSETKKLSLATLDSLFVDLSFPVPLTNDYVKFALNNKVKVPLVTIDVEPVDIFRCGKHDLMAWIYANVLRLNSCINYLLEIKINNIHNYNYHNIILELFSKYLYSLNIKTMYDVESRLMLYMDRKNDFIFTDQTYLDFQQFKARLYRLVSQNITERFRSIGIRMKLTEVIKILNSLHKCTLNYKDYFLLFNRYYEKGLPKLLSLVITSLYNNILLPMELRMSLLDNSLIDMNSGELMGYIYQTTPKSKFDKTALTRIYELS